MVIGYLTFSVYFSKADNCRFESIWVLEYVPPLQEW